MKNQSWVLAGTPGVKPSSVDIWARAGAQIGTALVVDFVGLAIDWKFHSIDYFSYWVQDMRRFVFYILIVVTIGGIRRGIAFVAIDIKHDSRQQAYEAPLRRFSW